MLNGVGKMGDWGVNGIVFAWRSNTGTIQETREIRKDAIMSAIVEFPNVVREAMDKFSDLFTYEPQRRHFGEYLTGLIVAENKSVTGINGEFVETTDQSCLNRFLTQSDWDESQLNERRLVWLQQDPTTAYSKRGTIAIDNTLIDHDGKFIKDVGWFWDHAEERYKIAHDYLFANYVCDSGKH